MTCRKEQSCIMSDIPIGANVQEHGLAGVELGALLLAGVSNVIQAGFQGSLERKHMCAFIKGILKTVTACRIERD